MYSVVVVIPFTRCGVVLLLYLHYSPIGQFTCQMPHFFFIITENDVFVRLVFFIPRPEYIHYTIVRDTNVGRITSINFFVQSVSAGA